MQNSGLGNAVNPIASLIDEKVYKIPMMFLVGWRGEPGKKDEPQHKKQGLITLELLEVLGIKYKVLDENVSCEDMKKYIKEAYKYMTENNLPYAFVIRKNTFSEYKLKNVTVNENLNLTREKAIANKEALIKTKNIKPRNLYLNLYEQYSFFKDNYQMRFTPPVQILYALKQAIIEAKEETIEKRNERYEKCCDILWRGLDDLNLKRLVDDENASKLLTTIIEPENPKYNFNEFHDYLYNKGFTIYPGKISSQNTFRVANIGDIYPENMKKFIEIMKDYFSAREI